MVITGTPIKKNVIKWNGIQKQPWLWHRQPVHPLFRFRDDIHTTSSWWFQPIKQHVVQQFSVIFTKVSGESAESLKKNIPENHQLLPSFNRRLDWIHPPGARFCWCCKCFGTDGALCLPWILVVDTSLLNSKGLHPETYAPGMNTNFDANISSLVESVRFIWIFPFSTNFGHFHVVPWMWYCSTRQTCWATPRYASSRGHIRGGSNNISMQSPGRGGD